MFNVCSVFSCNTTAKPPATIKILMIGGDWLQGAVLRHYVDLLGIRPPDWVNHLRFYIVPLCKLPPERLRRPELIGFWFSAGSSSISRYLSAIDTSYGSIFGGESWQQLCELAASLDAIQAKSEIQEIANRIQRYLHTAGPCTQIPIAEAMVNYKDEDSCQVFVPFVSVSPARDSQSRSVASFVSVYRPQDVRLGSTDTHQLSMDLDESIFSGILQQPQSSNSLLSGSSPPQSGRSSPPTTPAQSQLYQQTQQQSQPSANQMEALELQIDYWPIMKLNAEKERIPTKAIDQGKSTIKSTFRSLQVIVIDLCDVEGSGFNWLSFAAQVCRLPLHPQSSEVPQGLTVNYATKEKKQKSTDILLFLRSARRPKRL